MRKVILGLALGVMAFVTAGCSEVYEYDDVIVHNPSRTLDNFESSVSINRLNDVVVCHNCGLNNKDIQLDIQGGDVQSIIDNRHYAVLHITDPDSDCVYGNMAVIFKRSPEADWYKLELGKCEPTNVESVREENGKIIITAKNADGKDRTYLVNVKYK
ncbi:hypothetical protein DQR70_06265 [Salmonella enterica subsp. enterica serovar Oslo]|nr:hypothetical protein [Salmonella enterica subsp. enterica serovar Oslo]